MASPWTVPRQAKSANERAGMGGPTVPESRGAPRGGGRRHAPPPSLPLPLDIISHANFKRIFKGVMRRRLGVTLADATAGDCEAVGRAQQKKQKVCGSIAFLSFLERTLLGSSGLSRALLGSPGFSGALLGSPGLSWATHLIKHCTNYL